MKAKEILQDAIQQVDYMDEDNIRLVADIWGSYIEQELSPIDVAIMMALYAIVGVRDSEGFDEELYRLSIIDLAFAAQIHHKVTEKYNKVLAWEKAEEEKKRFEQEMSNIVKDAVEENRNEQ